MSRRALRALQLAIASAVFGSGAPLLWLCRDQEGAQACAIALIAIALLGLAVGELSPPLAASPGPSEAPKPTGDGGPSAHEKEAALDRVLRAIRRHIGVNADYREELEAFNDQLGSFPSLAEVGEIVAELMKANVGMRAEVAGLSSELEESRRQIVALRGNISEVGRIAMLDALTQLGNRRFFDEALQREIATARATDGSLCLAIADLDHFKSVNDRFGHVIGDHLLRLLAEILGRVAEAKGLVARYGGEEFALLFPKLTIAETARIVENLRRDLATKNWIVGSKEERLGVVTASFGIARLEAGESAESFVGRADAKLLEAKSLGRNRVVIDGSDAPQPRAAVNE